MTQESKFYKKSSILHIALIWEGALLLWYGEQLAQYMVHGVDAWLNNPLPPMEASGTSGMKAAHNGVPHLSIMDGWWMEGFNGKNGWAFGGEEVSGNRDQADVETLYQILYADALKRV